MNLRQLFSRMIMYKRYLKPFGVRKNAITISETVDIINDELMGAELKKKVVRNGLKLLQLICGKACAGSSIG